MCRNQSEVTAVLNDLGEDSETEPEAEGLGQAFEEGIPNLARLRLAVNYNQCQELAPRQCISTADAPSPFLRPVMSQGSSELRASGNDIGQEDRA